MPGVAGGQAREEAVVATRRQRRPGLYLVEPDVSWGAVAAA